jgi:phage terminase large subunit-like protein
LPPAGHWQVWLLLAGRGFGKTRTLAEWVCQQAASGQAGRIALVAATAGNS